MTKSDTIALASLIVAILAALTAAWSAILARRSYALARAQDARRRTPLEVHLLDSFASRGNGYRICAFDVTVSNVADAANTIKFCRLLVVRELSNGQRSSLVLDHDPALSIEGQPGQQLVNLPLTVPANSVVAGRVLFRVPLEMLQQADVESYTIEIVDTYGGGATKDAIFVNERIHG